MMPMPNHVTSTRSCFALLLVISAIVSSAAQTPSPVAAPPAPPTGVPLAQDYVIGPQDVLGVVFWREPEMSGDVTVRPDGRISLPVIGELQAAGLHPDALQKQIVTAAGKYLADPNVAVVVRTINSRRVFITGKVTTPGSHPLAGPLTVMQALALAGGLTEYADSKNITVLRTRNGQSQILKFNYKDVAKGKNTEQNIQLLPGDTVVVP
jgi:polysaccharide export outer membrane protein